MSTDLSHVPAAAAPPGYEVDFSNPKTKHNGAGIIISIVGMVLSTLFILLRVYTKTFLARMFGIDDIAMVLAWLISIGLQIMVVYLWSVPSIGIHMFEAYLPVVNNAVLLISVCSILYIPLMALAKFSLLVFYRRLSMDTWFRWAVYGTMVFVIGYSIALFFGLLFACTPLQMNWDITITDGHCANKGVMYLSTAGLNAATDVILLVMPIPMVSKLQVPARQKIGLLAMFAIGSLTLVTSLVRLSLLPPMVSATDVTYAISTPAIWICIEANLVVICGCLPILRLFFRHVAPRLIGEYSGGSGPRGRKAAGGGLSIAELSNLDRTKRSQRSHVRNEWSQWEREMAEDDGSEDFIVDKRTGRIVAAPSIKKKKSACWSEYSEPERQKSVALGERPIPATPYSQFSGNRPTDFGFPACDDRRDAPEHRTTWS
ncbi:hypothetical protein AC579_1482, partial [Pseudocercospora musae]